MSEPAAADLARAALEQLHATYKAWLSALNARGGDFETLARDGPSLATVGFEVRELAR